MKHKIIYLLVFILLGCSAQQKANRHLRKAKLHILKAESFGAKWQADTVYKNIEVIVPSVRLDTIVKTEVGDTVLITKERLKVRYVKLAGDSIFIEGECQADTIYKEVPITVTRQIHTPDKWKTPALAMAFCLLLFVIAGIGYLHLKK